MLISMRSLNSTSSTFYSRNYSIAGGIRFRDRGTALHILECRCADVMLLSVLQTTETGLLLISLP